MIVTRVLEYIIRKGQILSYFMKKWPSCMIVTREVLWLIVKMLLEKFFEISQSFLKIEFLFYDVVTIPAWAPQYLIYARVV